MADTPSADDTRTWQRRLASQANNRAWQLSEAAARTAAEDEEMLQAAHAAMHFWRIVGHAGNLAQAALLVAHVYALLALPRPARHYLAQSDAFFAQPERAPWEQALAAAVRANVAAAAGDDDEHRRSHALAEALVAALADPEDRQILEATLRVVPRPASTPEADNAAGRDATPAPSATPNAIEGATTTDLSANARLVAAVFEEVARGNGAPFWDACHDDVVWRTIGEGSWSGEFAGKQVIVDEIFRPLNLALAERATVPTRLIDGGDVIVLQARGRNRTRDGRRYDNDYAFVIHFRDGRIARYEEYCDTDLIARVLPDREAAKTMARPG